MGLAGRIVAGITAVVGLTLLYAHDPEVGGVFPSCPFRTLTGLLCPGCGSLRATHDLLHLRIAEAFAHNALLVGALPVLAFQWLHARWKPGQRPLSARNTVVFSWLAVVLIWAIVRNLQGGACMGH